MKLLQEPSVAVATKRLESLRSRTIPSWWWTAKRATDIVVASLLIVVSLPIMILAVAGICLVSFGTPFYLQERVGKDGRRFRLFKLRTMVPDAHDLRDTVLHLNEVSGPVFKIRDDPRLHALGRFLRSTSIDELPNLWNVIVGEMSIVGPRPSLPEEVAHYDSFAARRLRVKPGITCTWQISGRSGISFDQWMILDNAYVDTWTPLGDLVIIAKTAPAVLKGIGAH